MMFYKKIFVFKLFLLIMGMLALSSSLLEAFPIEITEVPAYRWDHISSPVHNAKYDPKPDNPGPHPLERNKEKNIEIGSSLDSI